MTTPSTVTDMNGHHTSNGATSTSSSNPLPPSHPPSTLATSATATATAAPPLTVHTAATPNLAASPRFQNIFSTLQSSALPSTVSPAADSDRPRISVADYVKQKGGRHVISRILIANNGIAAVKAIRSIRKWAYETFGNDKAIEFVAMATPEDMKVNAAYIHLADEFVSVPGGSNNNNYANVQLITDIAERTGAHAVWAGWGHASENPKLPESLAQTKNGVVWMGPPPSAMRALGDKIGSTLIAQTAHVPCMPWSGSGLTVNYQETGIPQDLYLKACVTTATEARAAADRIGYPVMIKASEGGGGKGIRRVTDSEQVDLAFAQVQGEVPGSPIFLMKLAPTCRHLEVQLLADSHGEAIAIFGRDCSIQRRHQKIIEEGPVVAAPPTVWRQMEQSAVRLAKEVGYIGAGTVEYLYLENGEYYFLELNPRLQVEHPVTELISGVNLPAAQLQVAMGIPLYNIRGVRRMYGEDPDTDTRIDFTHREAHTLPGHVIACRITAENPDMEFQPTSGVIQELNFRSTPDVWGYFSVAAKGGVHEYSDSQFGHMFALGETREIARRNMVLALKELSIRGDIRTTVEYLRKILETNDFRHNNINTTWLEHVMAKREVITEKPDTHLAVLLGALFRAHKSMGAKEKEYLDILGRGQLPSPQLHSDLVEMRMDLIYEKIKYSLTVSRCGPVNYELSINGWTGSAEAHSLSDDGMLVLLDAKKHVVYGQEFPSGLRLTVDGKTCLFHEEYDPTQLRSAMQGKLVRYLAADGTHVAKDKPYAEIEVMKMYITLTAPESGIIRTLKPEGSVLEAGDLMAQLVLDDPARVQKAEPFHGTFPAMRLPSVIGESPNLLLKHSRKQLQMLLSGYTMSDHTTRKAVSEMMQCLRDPRLPLQQFTEILSTLSGRIPQPLYDEFSGIIQRYQQQITNHRFYWESLDNFPVLDLQNAIDRLAHTLTEPQRATLHTQLNTAGVTPILAAYKDGNHTYAVQVLSSLFAEYYNVEQHFSDERPEYVVKHLRRVYKDDVAPVAAITRAHFLIGKRNALVLLLLDTIEQQLNPLVHEFLPTLRLLSSLVSKEAAVVALQARQVIMRQGLPSSSQRRIAIETLLNGASVVSDMLQRRDRLAPLIDQSQPIEDLIFSFFDSKRPAIQSVAMEAYIRRVYQVYTVPTVEVVYSKDSGGRLLGKWEFFMEGSNRDDDEDTPTGKLSPSASPSHQPLAAGDRLVRSASASVPTVGSVKEDGGVVVTNQTGSSIVASSTSMSNYAAGVHHPTAIVIPPASTAMTGAHQPIPSPTGGALTSRQRNAYFMRKVDSVRSLSNFRQHSSGTSVPPSNFGSPQQLSASASPEHSRTGGGEQEEWAEEVSLMNKESLPVRLGVMAFFPSFDAAKKGFADLLPEYDVGMAFIEPVHVLYVGFKWSGRLPADDQLAEYFQTLVHSYDGLLKEKGVRRVTFIVTQELKADGQEEYPMYFTYRYQLRYEEDPLVRHIEPSYAIHLQLQRLHNFDLRFVPTTNRMVHLFAAYPAKEPGAGVPLHGTVTNPMTERKVDGPYDGRRLFVRTIVRKVDSAHLYRVSDPNDLDLDAHPETEVAFVEALNSLELAVGSEVKQWRQNSIFLNLLVEVVVDVDYIEAVIRLLAKRYSDKIRRLHVATVEFTLTTKPAIDSLTTHAYRFYCSNPTGYVLNIDIYQERRDPHSGKIVFKYLKPVTDKTSYVGYWDGLDIYTPYPVSTPFQKQREAAATLETVYVYDLIPLMEKAVEKVWTRRNRPPVARGRRSRAGSLETPFTLRASKADTTSPSLRPDVLLTAVELVLQPAPNAPTPTSTTSSQHWQLVETTRAAGANTICMVAWKLTLRTPEYPAGRELVVIANDITMQGGTFGPEEDILFDLASKYARQRGLPRLYVAANSGARIGLAEELRHKFRIAWLGGDVTKGVAYLYLDATDYEQLKDSVIASPVTGEDGQQRYQIHDIVGKRNGLGVENLRGSGMIAGETSLAYDEIFTLTYVTGRTVGIGAYLARLGQRVIQKSTPPQPILLTGFNALNKLLGRQVYTSNVQLGGPEIMYTNGVSHLTVHDDMDGCLRILDWLSFVPTRRHAPQPLLQALYPDPVERRIDFKVGKLPYDVRHLLAGTMDDQQQWQSGFFDRDSWIESMAAWARSVVTGRARLGGQPVGVIAVETRTVEQIIPADPSDPNSKEQVVQRAGQVWYPDSAYKTAQAIKDYLAEDLPLLIFANWRGFSGGMKDMFDEILKFGSYIVDALRVYTQPVFVYIPPNGTLRGGAWVVVDQTINPRYMEMYADDSGRAGVLETEGTLDVKFRKKDILAQAHRLDDQLVTLNTELKTAEESGKDGSSSSRPRDAILKDIRAREEKLYPVYYQVANLFADLHDTPGRMQAKGCLQGTVSWEKARTFFYYRLQRRLLEYRYMREIASLTQPLVSASMSDEAVWNKARETLYSFLPTDAASRDQLSDDRTFLTMWEQQQPAVNRQMEKLKQGAFAQKVKLMLASYERPAPTDGAAVGGDDKTVDGLVAVIGSLSSSQKKRLEVMFLAPAAQEKK